MTKFEQNIELAERLFGLMKQDIEERNKMAEIKEKFTDRRWEIEEEIRQAKQDIEERNKMAETKEKFMERVCEAEEEIIQARKLLEEIRQARKLLFSIEDGLTDLYVLIYPSRETDYSDD